MCFLLPGISCNYRPLHSVGPTPAHNLIQAAALGKLKLDPHREGTLVFLAGVSLSDVPGSYLA